MTRNDRKAFEGLLYVDDKGRTMRGEGVWHEDGVSVRLVHTFDPVRAFPASLTLEQESRDKNGRPVTLRIVTTFGDYREHVSGEPVVVEMGDVEP